MASTEDDSSRNRSRRIAALNLLKSLDLFRVVQDTDRHLTPVTAKGSLISTTYAIALTLLVLNETRLYFTPTIDSSMVVNSHPFEMETLHFDVSFRTFPCEAMVLEALDPMTGRVFEEQQSTVRLTKTAYFEEGSSGCRLAGTMEIDKIPGNFMLAAKNFPQGAPVPPTAFTVHDLWIGDVEKVKYTDAALTHTMKDTRMVTAMPNLIFQYFLQVVPTLVHNDRGHVEETAYQYTVTSSAVVAPGVPPGLYFHHRHNPLSVELHVKWQSLSHFLVHLCAIGGGLFIVMGFAVRGAEWAQQRMLKGSDGGLSR